MQIEEHFGTIIGHNYENVTTVNVIYLVEFGNTKKTISWKRTNVNPLDAEILYQIGRYDKLLTTEDEVVSILDVDVNNQKIKRIASNDQKND
ncbi:MAG: hypothetical protein K6F37_09030 [Lachnospiraceae bacterium]|nr:hypothetical protein [Lachnospiraceae bacterium]